MNARLSVVAVTIILVAGLTSVAHSTTSPAPGAVVGSDYALSVTATDSYGYQPNLIQNAPNGAVVTVTFTDASDLPHSFTIVSREGYVVPTSLNPGQLAQFLSTYPPLFSMYVNFSGDQHTQSFESPASPGWYEFLCNVSGHFELGMYGFIAFGENLPSNISPPPRTGVGGIVLGLGEEVAIGVLIGALLLGAIAWRYYRTPPPSDPRSF